MRPIIPVHPQSMAYFKEMGLLKKTSVTTCPVILWSCVCVALLACAIRYRSAIERFAQKHVHVELLTTFVCLYVIGTLAMFFCERYNNQSFESIPESFWSITVYLFSGFEDRYPVTWPGRVISVLIFILSVFFFGAVAGRFAAAFLRREENRMPRDVTDHIVICNWNERGRRVITELRHPEAKPDTDIVIVDNNLVDEKGSQKFPSLHKVYCINETPFGTAR